VIAIYPFSGYTFLKEHHFHFKLSKIIIDIPTVHFLIHSDTDLAYGITFAYMPLGKLQII